jgi:broad specificity phosphatase PhoE
MKLIFVRHGQATHNSDAKTRGEIAYFDPIHTDSALDTIGLEQVLKTREIFPSEKIDVIYCSPIQRCRQTLLAVIPESNNLPVRLDDRVMESQGLAYCNKRSERHAVIASSPSAWDCSGVAETNPFDTLKECYSLAVSEMPEFCERVRVFMEYLLATHAEDETILIVGHHDWIRTWFYLYKGVKISPVYAGILWADVTKQKVD